MERRSALYLEGLRGEENISELCRREGIAVINSVGNLAGFVSPYLIGWIIDQTKPTDLGVFTLAVSIALGSLLILVMPTKLVNR